MAQLHLENLNVYQRSIALALNIYMLSQLWPKEHLFGITDQLRRASLSISLNIAEGYGRTRKDFQRFLVIARGSCYECLPIIKIASSLKLLSTAQEQTYYNELIEISRMLSALKNRLGKS